MADLKKKLKKSFNTKSTVRAPGAPTGLFSTSMQPTSSPLRYLGAPSKPRPKHDPRPQMVSSRGLDEAGHPRLAGQARHGENSATGMSMTWAVPGKGLAKKKFQGSRAKYVRQGSTYAKNRAKEALRIKNLPAPEEDTKPAAPVKFKKLDSNRYP